VFVSEPYPSAAVLPLVLVTVIVIAVLITRPDARVGVTCGAILLAVAETSRRLQ
jgi:hypothetical protein